MAETSFFWLMVIGFGLGLKHATEPDHLAAVSTIVGERKKLWAASLVGGLWGIGHTTALLTAGIIMLTFQFEIGSRVSQILEFCVALMLIGLGIEALRKVYLGREVHWHAHRHGGILHAHPHIHEAPAVHPNRSETKEKTHHGLRLTSRPLLIGLIHGFAGSGALMLLILSTVQSSTVGFAYITAFGFGSIGGMMLMSTLIGLPFQLSSNRFSSAGLYLRGAAGMFSLLFGIFLAYKIGVTDGLFT